MSHEPENIEQLKTVLADRYVIQREIGSGGMARIYLAEDVKHERTVALKVLRPELAAVLGGERFLREIKLTASLNHPHILPLLDSGEAGRVLFYVMPYVEGESLRQKLNRETQLSMDEAIRLTQQAAAALHHAHQQSVMHRDIKPENILLHEGVAMVADFGIALALNAAGGDRLTETGLSIGTPEYMSPEQASGSRHIDARTDIYALGCVLHEMLTGDPPFTGPSAQGIIARQVLDPPPSIRTVRPSVSEELERIVQRALAKAPADRWQTANELHTALGSVVMPYPVATPVGAEPIKVGLPRWNLRWIVAAVAVAAIAFAAWLLRPSISPPRGPPVHEQVTFRGDVVEADISADGQFLGFIAREADSVRAFVQDLATGYTVTIASHPHLLCCVSWSPDGTRILVGFPARDDLMGLYAFPRFGGAAQRVQDWPFGTWEVAGERVVSWAMDWDSISFADISESGVTNLRLREKPFEWTTGLEQHPGGDLFALVLYDGARDRSALWTFIVDSLQRSRNQGSGEVDSVLQQRLILEEPGTILMPLWAPTGDALYFARPSRSAFDLVKLEFSGASRAVSLEPKTILSGLEIISGEYWPSAPLGTAGITAEGHGLHYVKGREYSNLWQIQPGLTPDEAPNIKPLTSGTGVHEAPTISPDGSRVAYRSHVGAAVNIFVMPVDGGEAVQATFVDSVATNPAWSPDGERLAFGVMREGGVRLAVAPVGASTPARVLESTDLGINGLVAWAPYDHIMYQVPSARNWKIVNPETEDERLLLSDDDALSGWLFSPHVSPDRRDVAVFWNRDRGGVQEQALYLIALDGELPNRRIAGNVAPIGWAPDGSAVFGFGVGELVLYRVPVDGSDRTVVTRLPDDWSWDPAAPVGTVMPNGGGFIMEESGVQADVWVIENFDPVVR